MAEPVPTLQEIEDVKDLGQARKLSKRFDPRVNLSKCDLAKQKERLKLALKKHERKMKDVDALGQMMKEKREQDKYQRDLLIQYFDQFKEILSSMDEKMRRHVERKEKEVEPEKEIERICAKLKAVSPKLIVAGETSSGKSTLLNIFLSEDQKDKKPLLPAKLLSCTATVCEMSYNEFPMATVVKRTGETPISFDDRYQFIYKESERDQRFDHECVKLKIPSFILKNGITIVDTPGVSENEEMGSVLKDYVMQNEPFGFIFTIASNRAGGVLKKFQNLLLELSSSDYVDDFGQRKFDPRSCVFVANFWDEVSDKDKDATRENIHKTLSNLQCMANFSPKNQVFFLDAEFAFQTRGAGYITEDFSRFIDGLEDFVWKEQRRKLKLAYRILESSVKRILHPLKSYITRMQQNQDSRFRNKNDTTKTLENIERRLKKDIADHRKQLKAEIEKCSQELYNFFSSKGAVERIQDWRSRDLPKEQYGDDWVLIEVKLDQAIDARVSDMLKDWEQRTQIITKCEGHLFELFIGSMNKYRTELDEIERKLRNESGNIEIGEQTPPLLEIMKNFPNQEDNEVGREFTVKQGETFGYAIMAIQPETENLLDSVSSGPVMKVLRRSRGKKKNESKEQDSVPNGVEEYCRDKVAYMQQRAYRIFATMCNREYSLTLATEQLKSVEDYLALSDKELSKVIETNRLLLEAIAKEKRQKSEIDRVYIPLEKRATQLLEVVLEFGQKYVIDPRFHPEDIELSQPFKQTSLFAKLCRGTFTRKFKKQPPYEVTLKAVLMKPSERALQESYIRRYTGRNDEIVRYYGTYNLNKEMTLVLRGSLITARTYFFEYQRQDGKGTEVRDLFLSNLVTALQFLHLRNLVHPEVSLDSVLIKRSQNKMSPLLSNLLEPCHISIPADADRWPVSGYIHLPPEVLHGKEQYTPPADIYGVGVIMVELWYQTDVFAEMKSSVTLKQWLEKDDIKDTLMKTAKKDKKKQSSKVWDMWKSLAKHCLDKDPNKRINIADWHNKWVPIIGAK